MKFQYCKGCRTSFNGVRCPSCGRPIPAVGLVTIFLPLAVCLIILSWVIPDETVPRVVQTGNSTVYVFQSLQEAILWPAGAAMLLIIGAINIRFSKYKPKSEPELEAIKSSPGPMQKAGKVVQKLVTYILFIMLGLVFFCAIVVIPLRDFRRVEVSHDTVTCKSLYKTVVFNIQNLTGAHVVQTPQTKQGVDYLDNVVIIHNDARSETSVSVSLPVSDEKLPVFINTMKQCVQDINARRGIDENNGSTPLQP